MRRLSLSLVTALVLAASVLVAVPHASPAASAAEGIAVGFDRVHITATVYSDGPFALLAYINRKRADRGVPALAMDIGLLNAAVTRAAELNLVRGGRPNDGSDLDLAPQSSASSWAWGTGYGGSDDAAFFYTRFSGLPGLLGQETASIGIASVGDGVAIFLSDSPATRIASVRADRLQTFAIDVKHARSDALSLDMCPVYTDDCWGTARRLTVGPGAVLPLTVSFNYRSSYLGGTSIHLGDVVFRSSNPKVARVGADGIVTARKTGKTTITAVTAGGTKGVFTLRVRGKAVAVKKLTLGAGVSFSRSRGFVPKKKATLKRGGTLVLQRQFSPIKPTNTVVVYRSSDRTVASVDRWGRVSAHKRGSVVITGRTPNGKKDTVRIVVR